MPSMRQMKIFSGSSHPNLADAVCERLGQDLAKADLGKFANGETKVQLNTSIRNQDVFIVQSGSNMINDDVMELLIMISACKSGSAKSITAVIPYFPYSRQSKKKSHRGAITARMIANLLDVAGATHIITIDLHASQMQGFFHCPIDNLFAEPLIADHLRKEFPDYKRAVVVSKNPGGTKRVTSLADNLKLNFGIVMTDRYRVGGQGDIGSMVGSQILPPKIQQPGLDGTLESKLEKVQNEREAESGSGKNTPRLRIPPTNGASPSPLHHSVTFEPEDAERDDPKLRTESSSTQEEFDTSTNGYNEEQLDDSGSESGDEGDIDPRSRDIITGRLVQGHIVEDSHPSRPYSPTLSARSANHSHGGGSPEDDLESLPDAMLTSYMSTMSGRLGKEGLGGSGDAGASDDEEEHLVNPEMDSMVTLVGNVRDRPVFILDDMMDKPASWIAAAETVVKRGGATHVICIATHGLFGDNCLEELEACECIDQIIVTNSAPVSDAQKQRFKKLKVLDVAGLLTEAIRRTYHGESMHHLYFQSYA